MKKIAGFLVALMLLGFGFVDQAVAHKQVEPLVSIEGGMIQIDEAILTGSPDLGLCLTQPGNMWGNDLALGREACGPENLFTRVIVERSGGGKVKRALWVIEAWKVQKDENGEFTFSAAQPDGDTVSHWILAGDENELKVFRKAKLRRASRRLREEKTALGRMIQIKTTFNIVVGAVTRGFVISPTIQELTNLRKFLEMFVPAPVPTPTPTPTPIPTQRIRVEGSLLKVPDFMKPPTSGPFFLARTPGWCTTGCDADDQFVFNGIDHEISICKIPLIDKQFNGGVSSRGNGVIDNWMNLFSNNLGPGVKILGGGYVLDLTDIQIRAACP